MREAEYWIDKIPYCINTKAQIKKGVSVPVDAMEPRDMIFFDWNGNGLSNHVGVCSGKNEMIDEHGSNSDPNHPESRRKRQKDIILAYYRKHILDIRRIIQENS